MMGKKKDKLDKQFDAINEGLIIVAKKLGYKNVKDHNQTKS